MRVYNKVAIACSKRANDGTGTENTKRRSERNRSLDRAGKIWEDNIKNELEE
jgi:hypothetical protein